MPGPYCYDYPRPAVTVDLVAFRCREGQLQVLLIQRKHEPFTGRWAIPGGFLDMDETAEAGARREFQEETTLTPPGTVSFLAAFDAPDRDPRARTISLAHVGLLPPSTPEPQGADDASHSAWVDLATLDFRSLAFDHAAILDTARHWLGTAAAFVDSWWLDLLDSPFDRESARGLFRTIEGHSRRAGPWLARLRQSGQIVVESDDHFRRVR